MKIKELFFLHILMGGFWQEPEEFSTEDLALSRAKSLDFGDDWYITKGADSNTPIHSA